MSKFIGPLKALSKREKDPLIQAFMALDGRSDFPVFLAQHSLLELKVNTIQNGETEDDLLLYLLEDSLFASLNATFYEALFEAIQETEKKGHELTLKLIQSFEADEAEREQILAQQTHQHLEYIKADGKCEGCSSCENHKDVKELIKPFKKKDLDFFDELYLGMQSIQFTMDHILYDLIPQRPSIAKNLRASKVLQLRQYIFEYSNKSTGDN
jgi:hypothetical protein